MSCSVNSGAPKAEEKLRNLNLIHIDLHQQSYFILPNLPLSLSLIVLIRLVTLVSLVTAIFQVCQSQMLCHFLSHVTISFLITNFLKGTLSGLKQFLATESLFKMMKNAFYFTLKAFFILKVFKFLP